MGRYSVRGHRDFVDAVAVLHRLQMVSADSSIELDLSRPCNAISKRSLLWCDRRTPHQFLSDSIHVTAFAGGDMGSSEAWI